MKRASVLLKAGWKTLDKKQTLLGNWIMGSRSCRWHHQSPRRPSSHLFVANPQLLGPGAKNEERGVRWGGGILLLYSSRGGLKVTIIIAITITITSTITIIKRGIEEKHEKIVQCFSTEGAMKMALESSSSSTFIYNNHHQNHNLYHHHHHQSSRPNITLTITSIICLQDDLLVCFSPHRHQSSIQSNITLHHSWVSFPRFKTIRSLGQMCVVCKFWAC